MSAYPTYLSAVLAGPTQTFAVGTSSTASASTFGSQTRQVYVCSTVAACIVIGNSPTATTTSTYLPANFPFVFKTNPGESIAAILPSGTTAGTLYCTELS